MSQGYQVEDVLQKKVENGEVYYRIKWKGYPSSTNSWEPERHLTPDLISYFQQQQEERLARRQEQEKKKYMRSLHRENRPRTIHIEGHFLRADRKLMFEARREGGKKEQIQRTTLIEQHGIELAKYYVQLAKKTDHY